MRMVDVDELKLELKWLEVDTPVYHDVMSTIDEMPTVDPVKHGEWIPKITALGTMIFRCSACQKFNDVHWAYCPQCGAIMDGERREDETD